MLWKVMLRSDASEAFQNLVRRLCMPFSKSQRPIPKSRRPLKPFQNPGRTTLVQLLCIGSRKADLLTGGGSCSQEGLCISLSYALMCPLVDQRFHSVMSRSHLIHFTIDLMEQVPHGLVLKDHSEATAGSKYNVT